MTVKPDPSTSDWRETVCGLSLLCSLLLYFGSFVLPYEGGIPGLMLFLFGWISPSMFVMWLGNPLAWIGLYWLLKRRRRPAVTFAACALICGLLFPIVVMATSQPSSWRFPGWGYVFWVGSFVALLCSACFVDELHADPTSGPEMTPQIGHEHATSRRRGERA